MEVTCQDFKRNIEMLLYLQVHLEVIH